MAITKEELDVLSEIVNIGSGRAAFSLSEMTGSRIELSVPQIRAYDSADFQEMAKSLNLQIATSVQQGFQGTVSGQALLAFPDSNAFELARIVGGIPATTEEMDQELCGVLEEIGNIVLNAILGSLANLVDCSLSYSLPKICTGKNLSDTALGAGNQSKEANSVILIADTSIIVASHNISGSLILLFETGDLEIMLSHLTASPTS